MKVICLILSLVIVAIMYADDWHETSLRYKLADEKLKIERERIKHFYGNHY